MSWQDKAAQALSEVQGVLNSALPDQIETMATPIQKANRIAVYGVGREGLMMKSLAMRLFHLGHDVHVVGDMTTPPIGSGDLLIISAGPGHFSTVAGLVGVAKQDGATTLCVTAEPEAAVPQTVDHVVHLAAQTMANDRTMTTSILPMGSLFEATQFLFFELLILHLRDAMGLSPDQMRANHTNLE
ncbi:hexulose-6-phosphate isomerase [Tateyamaria omphalii]|uniref:6-phospho-3-hexuloisomerase n=1 Tax=Tateyamaria omphalii TaxID=299262 RepID=UPI001673E7B1|nr:6-phospho-3-hexuloisomerase [Tateyamaria omphalii]GGX43035.1 hexulose-6-phosphate isomerase [Tateyamaria omphalii]